MDCTEEQFKELSWTVASHWNVSDTIQHVDLEKEMQTNYADGAGHIKWLGWQTFPDAHTHHHVPDFYRLANQQP